MKFQWRVLQLLPGMDRPSYAGLRVEVLERADGELLIRYQGEVVDFQEAAPPSAALWGEGSGSFPSPEGSEVADGAANGHLDDDQRKLLAGLDSSVRRKAWVKRASGLGRGTQGKPLRHQLHRTPTPTQQARWEAVQQARSKGLSQRAIAQKLGMSRDTVGKYAKAENPPTKLLSAKERPRPRPWLQRWSLRINQGDIFAGQQHNDTVAARSQPAPAPGAPGAAARRGAAGPSPTAVEPLPGPGLPGPGGARRQRQCRGPGMAAGGDPRRPLPGGGPSPRTPRRTASRRAAPYPAFAPRRPGRPRRTRKDCRLPAARRAQAGGKAGTGPLVRVAVDCPCRPRRLGGTLPLRSLQVDFSPRPARHGNRREPRKEKTAGPQPAGTGPVGPPGPGLRRHGGKAVERRTRRRLFPLVLAGGAGVAEPSPGPHHGAHPGRAPVHGGLG